MSYFVYFYNLESGYFTFGENPKRTFSAMFTEFEKSYSLVKRGTFIVLDSDSNKKEDVWKKGHDIRKILIESGLMELDSKTGWFKTTKDILKKLVVIIIEYGMDLRMYAKQEETGKKMKSVVSDKDFLTINKNINNCITDYSKTTSVKRYLKLT
jgi:hypothetical protein